MIVAGDHDVDRPEPRHGLQLVEGVLDEAQVRRHVVPARKAVVQEQRAPVVGHQRVAVRHRVRVRPEVGEDVGLRLVHGVGPDRPHAVLPHLGLEAVEHPELRLEEAERRAGVVGRMAVRRAEALERQPAEEGDRVERRAGGVGHPVLPLEIVDRVDVAGLGDQVPAEADGHAVDLGEEGHGPLRVPGRRQHPDVVAAPRERLVVAKGPRDPDRAGQGEADAGDVVVVVDALEPPEGVGLGEKGGLALGHRDRDAARLEEVVALALVAVVVRVEHPVDLAHAGLGEVLEDPARAEVDQEAPVPPGEEVDVARVLEPVEARREPDQASSRGGVVGVAVSVVVRPHPNLPCRECSVPPRPWVPGYYNGVITRRHLAIAGSAPARAERGRQCHRASGRRRFEP